MLGNVKRYSRIYLAYGYTDLRYGIDGLARVVHDHFSLDPFQKGCLFLFCGRRTDRIKGLLWEGDGFVLVYKRLEAGRFQWPRTASEAREITPEQFTWLMQGLAVEQKKKDTGSRTEKDMLIGMLTGFVQNIEIFLPVSGGAFPCPGSKKRCT